MTDARLPAALARAAELVAVCEPMYIVGFPHGSAPNEAVTQVMPDALAGWAQAIQAHAERPESEHDGGCSAGISKLPCKCSQRDRTEAITKFCDAMRKEAKS